MKNYLLVVIKDGQEAFMPIFEKIKDSNSYKTLILSLEELLSNQWNNEIRAFKIFNIFILVNRNSFSSMADKVYLFFQDLLHATFGNIIFIYDQLSVFKNESRIEAYHNSYIFFINTDIELQVFYFEIFMFQLFLKAQLSFRLSDHIYNSFKEIIYSEILSRKNREIEHLNEELQRKNRVDYLTNLFNRKALYECLEQERQKIIKYMLLTGTKQVITDKYYLDVHSGESTKESKRNNYFIYSIMLIDIDRFKMVNDTYGHHVGDIVLKTLSLLFRRPNIFRDCDTVGRYGGEEFLIILPGSSSKDALFPAARLADELSECNFEGTGNVAFKITLSIGISQFHPFDKDNDELVQRADKALYYAKQNGRNRAVCYEDIFND